MLSVRSRVEDGKHPTKDCREAYFIAYYMMKIRGIITIVITSLYFSK